MKDMSDNNCGTGCQDPKHMNECFKCGAKYHYGLIHFCPTSFTPDQPSIIFTPPVFGLQKMEKPKPIPNHVHLAYFGSELGCEICNPVCWKNHKYGSPDMLKWCGEEKCPMNPERFKKPTFPVTYNQELADYLSSPREGVSPREKKEIKKGLDALKTEEAKPFVPVIRSRSDECWEEEEELEAKEDAIRMSKRKSIRKGGKYKERGKEKRREP